MITDNMNELYTEALKYATFETIRDTVLDNLADSPDFTAIQKVAVKLAGERIKTWEPTPGRITDGPLRGVMEITWPDIGLPVNDVDALIPEQRHGIIQAVMTVCRGIIEAERARLLAVVELDTDFPVEEPAE